MTKELNVEVSRNGGTKLNRIANTGYKIINLLLNLLVIKTNRPKFSAIGGGQGLFTFPSTLHLLLKLFHAHNRQRLRQGKQ